MSHGGTWAAGHCEPDSQSRATGVSLRRSIDVLFLDAASPPSPAGAPNVLASQATTSAVLTDWAGAGRRQTGRKRQPRISDGLRFAFYGRMSTKEHQDQQTSYLWQHENASELVTGHGLVVAEFFDVGYSRRLPWSQRPKARQLLAALTDPNRPFDAIVIGECERAFYGNQFTDLMPIFARYGVQVWLPELCGPYDPGNPVHDLAILQLSAQSRREVLRSRFRTTAAMRGQAREQGRYLGGRPPYGYRLTEAGPHPNRADARRGRRRLRLDPDPATARVVTWMFTQRLTGRSIASITRELNENHVPCPSDEDRKRNSHRTNETWSLRSVAAILENPRYTGHEVWNRQRTDREPIDPAAPSRGYREVLRWNPASEWVISTRVVHPPLVSEQDFIAVQAVRSTRPTADGKPRVYLLAGLMQCGLCGRRMDAHWVNHRPGYRCRHGHSSAKPADATRPGNLYVREDETLVYLSGQLACLGADLNQHNLVKQLRDHGMTIICGVDGWMLGTVADATPQIPTQRRPDRLF
ncbi:recombinase family protein [Micromonospora haikouensis]|uniref:recombinase family protein n=1 Tax=Micromonospora haikouensis TaxID=686309 RepID=UPI003F4CF174